MISHMTGTHGSPLHRLERRTVVSESGCWIWTGGEDGRGYGQMFYNGGPRKTHIVGWNELIGPVPDGLTLDHLCRNTKCWNPEHLDPCTRTVNTDRQLEATGHPNSLKTHCPHGHRYETEGQLGSRRVCKPCHARVNRQYRERKKVSA